MWQDCKVMWVAVNPLKFGLNFTVVSSMEFFSRNFPYFFLVLLLLRFSQTCEL